MHTITKQFKFTAKRQLSGFPIDHPYAQLQTKEFTVVFDLSSISLNKDGYIMDYMEFFSIENFILSELQGKTLNNVFRFNPTSENMAKFFFKRFKKTYHFISAVTVVENHISARYILSHDEEDHIEIETKREEMIKVVNEFPPLKKDTRK
jgi:6-pyruvoyltetrahydropterin/6-carboxytetrahydropterin synthase